MKTFWIFLVVHSTIQSVYMSDNNYNCQEGRNGFRDIVMYCPNLIGASIEVTIKEKRASKVAEIECKDNRLDVSILDVNLSNVTFVTIRGCQLPANITSLFEHWNITDPETVKLLDYILPNDGILDSGFFQGFPKHNLKALQIKNASVQHVDEDAFIGFDNLEILDFEHNNISVMSDFFKHLPNLKRTSIERNSLTELPDVITAPKLERLHLQTNKLENLTSNVFSSAATITMLDVSVNNLKYISDDLLHPLKGLTDVFFGLAGEFNLSEEFFVESSMMKTIRFRGGNITYISPKAFHNQSKLILLSIYDCKLLELQLGTFDQMPSLIRLLLGENKIEELPDGIFANLFNLTELDLTGNNLKEWSPEYHRGNLKKLTTLTLNKNKFETLGDLSFHDLPNLEVLKLARNKIKTINMMAFDPTSRVTTLDLSFNLLTNDYDKSYNLPLQFNNLIYLKNLYLDNNFYSSLPHITLLPNQILSMRNNNLTSLNIDNILHFKEVILSGNQIEYVEFGPIFYFANDEKHSLKVDINRNPLRCDCSTLGLVNFFNRSLNGMFKNNIEIKVNSTYCQQPANLKDSRTPIKNFALENITCKRDECPIGCDCTIYPVNNTLTIGCSGLNLTEPPEFSGFVPFNVAVMAARIDKCVVNLNDNRISNFDENLSYENITGLYLSNNNLSNLRWLPPKIEVLRLDRNRFTNLDNASLSLLDGSESLQKLALNDNPWKCDCSLLPFAEALKGNLTLKLENKHRMRCENGDNVNYVYEADLCRPTDDSIIVTILYALLVIFLLSVTVLMILYHIYEQSVKIWLYDRSVFLWFVTEEEIDKEREFDAFVSYSHKDEEFIEKHLVPELETGDPPFKLCVHNRDWIVGEFILRQIIESVGKSRRTIIVLSKYFLESTWATTEFRTAYEQAMSEKRNRIIVILYDDIDVNNIQDGELKTYLKSNTYIKWGDPWFWKRLRYAMPHKREPEKKPVPRNTRIENMMISIDDKIDLTDSPMTPNTQTPPAISADPLLLKVSPLQFKLSNETPPAESGMLGTQVY